MGISIKEWNVKRIKRIFEERKIQKIPELLVHFVFCILVGKIHGKKQNFWYDYFLVTRKWTFFINELFSISSKTCNIHDKWLKDTDFSEISEETIVRHKIDSTILCWSIKCRFYCNVDKQFFPLEIWTFLLKCSITILLL